MRAVKMRNGGPLHAVSSSSEAADVDERRHSSPLHHAADTSLSSTGTSGSPLDSKGATMAAVQRPVQQQQTDEYDEEDDESVSDRRSTDVSQADARSSVVAAVYEDADSPYFAGQVDPLAEAIASDAPMDFTARDDPHVVARLPLAFCDLLPTMDQQLLYRQRQEAHQTAVDAPPPLPPPRLTSSSTKQPAVSDFVWERLPLAVGRVPGCKTQLRHGSAATEGANGNAVNNSISGSSSSNAKANNATAGVNSVAEEQRQYRERVAEEVLDYLLCPTASQSHHQQQHQASDEKRYEMVESCLSGLREVPPDTVEYGEVLSRLVAAADAASNSSHNHNQQQQQQQQHVDGDGADMEVNLPSYVRPLLTGRPTSGRERPRGAAPASVLPVGNDGTASAAPRATVVASTARAALDALLPPRMLLYYLVSYEAAVAVQEQRRSALAQQAELRQAVQEHPDDQQSAAALAALSELLTGPYARTPVGVVLVVLERTSDVQAPREYLKGLEGSVDEILARCRARCCGRALKVVASVQNAQHPPASATLAPHRPAQVKPNGDKTKPKSRTAAAGAATATTTTTLLSTEKNPVCARTTRPLPARPTALSSSGGGSASVVTTLNVVELNAERRLVQLDLLGEELLRQVTVDLPERGVLLRRVLDEAHLSLDARGVVARERVAATQQSLLEGQDAREALAAAQARLSEEAEALRQRLAFLTARKAGLTAWAEERVARASVERHARVDFAEQLRRRLTAHTEAVKAAQEAARQSAMA